MEVFLEAKAFWEHTCIADGLFLLPTQKKTTPAYPLMQPLIFTYSS